MPIECRLLDRPGNQLRVWLGAILMSTTVLIVDDSPPIRRSLRAWFERRDGWEVCGEAENGAVAVERVKALNPDIVILDLSMPPPGKTSVAYPDTAKIGVLNALIASNRNSRLLRSVKKNFFERLMSTCFKPGPRSLEIGQLPSLPGAGMDIVVGSNHTYPPPTKFL